MENTATMHVQISYKFITVSELTVQFTNLNRQKLNIFHKNRLLILLIIRYKSKYINSIDLHAYHC